jgi:DNA-binding CsgD family transcriptional regulator/tetratricopeptide (TPR) repeat protein
LTRLLPGLRARGDDPTAAVADETKDPDAERHELHTALTALLAKLARDAPVVLVLDDVQWADPSSLILLRHLARTLGATPTVMLALFRDGHGELPDALASTLAELHRLDGVVRIRLGGLDVADVQELLHRSDDSVRGGDGELAAQLVELTDGNAFLVGEVWRHMLNREGSAERSSPADATIPESVREVMAARVAGLTPALGELVKLIAVSPRGIALPVLRATAEMDDESLIGALDEGLRAGMLEEIREASLVYRVRHELLRRTVYERLSSVRAAALHLRLGEALEAMAEGRRERIVNELAFHFRAAAPIAGNGRAVEYALDAAAQAEHSLAFAEAAGRLEEALALGVPDRFAEAEVRCRQGRAWHLAGRSVEALESFADAAVAARECGDGALQARAAIGFETACWPRGIADRRAVALLREATLGIAPGPSAQRVRVLAHLSRALAYQGDHAAAGQCWSQAVAMARRVADPRALMVALSHAAWTRGSRALDEILADLTEAGALARTLPHDYLSDVAPGMRIALLIEAFAIDEARVDNAALRELSERAGQPFLAQVVEQHDALLALCDGRLDAAEAAANRSDEIARRTEEEGHSAVHGIQMFSIRREQGRLAEIAPLVRLIASGRTEVDSVWRPALALLLAEIGDAESARGELQALVDADLGAIIQGGLGVGGLTYAADACALIEDAELAAPIYEQLLPFEGHNMVIGSAVACYGAADRMLGALATVMRQWDVAERHLENALVLNRRMGSPTWIAHTWYERARLTVRRGRPHEVALAWEQSSEALDAAQRIGLRGLVAHIERLTASLPAPTAADDLSPREVEVLRVVARGLSNREAGATLHLSERTVARHLRSILRKTGCANRTQATAYAVRHGIAEPERRRPKRT